MSDYQDQLDAFGRELSRAARRHAGSPAGHWRLLVAGGMAAAAVVVVWAVALGGAGDRLSFVERAEAALAPDGKVVHAILRTFVVRQPGSKGVPAPADTIETWSAADPARWRMVQQLPRQQGSNYFGRLEIAYADGRQQSYLAHCDTLTTTTGFDEDDQESASTLPTPFGLDPVVRLSSMLADDQLRDTGTVMVGERRARRLEGSLSGPPLERRIAYLIDEETYEPISATLSIGAAGAAPKQRFVLRYEIARFERLDETQETEPLLRIQITKETRRRYRRLPLTAKQKLRFTKEGGCRDDR